ncbi:hypothetical protein DENSPDRAFT_774306 [Dentipellis sp. KUC8613]|nr:hypothetical protein DENSPDRAFT_774306 [Dentipellis sp. KUC8613]
MNAPVDAVLWIHMFLQAAVWGILFPIGMVLGITRSRWHVPLQASSAGFVLTLGGYILGHAHKGRQFLPSAHGKFANIIFIPIILQLALGVYLKLHIHERTLRPWAVRAHGVVGKAYSVIGWVQMVFGAIAFRGYCRGDDLGQCLAHYIMGGGFIAYGVIMAILLLVGEMWVRRSGRSPEWWDSWVILLWGIVNTFTEHRGTVWSVKDMQHTILGILWWCGGILGVFLARNNQRTVVPAIIIILTGYGMANHAQALMLSTAVHSMFGYTLMLAGVTRIIEVCFIVPKFYPVGVIETGEDNQSEHTLADGNGKDEGSSKGRSFRHLPPFVRIIVPFMLLFMSATDEELHFVNDNGMDHVTYILIMFSIAFLLYTHILFLINLYSTSGRNAPDAASNVKDVGAIELTTPTTSTGRWYSRLPNGHGRNDSLAAEPTNPLMNSAHVIGEEEEEE